VSGGTGDEALDEGAAATDDVGAYCRQVERYLCRRNDGHLIRIVGPSFERVCAWAARGIPLKLVFRGIDRYFERYYAKGPRRHPVRIDFCEADVLDTFDEWRRAVGVAGVGVPGQAGDDESESRRAPHSLPAHLERVIARLTVLRAGSIPPELDRAIDAAVRDLDAMRAGAKGLRGDARRAAVARLGEIDAALASAVRSTCDDAEIVALGREADAQLTPFRDRMPPDRFEQARVASLERLIRDRAGLPRIAYD
jgi:hypothetical protein